MSESEQATLGRSPRSGTQKTADAELRSLTDVAMVQAADFGKLHDPPRRGELDGLRSGASLSSASGYVPDGSRRDSGSGCGGGVAR